MGLMSEAISAVIPTPNEMALLKPEHRNVGPR
jgi:hypothetical protein